MDMKRFFILLLLFDWLAPALGILGCAPIGRNVFWLEAGGFWGNREVTDIVCIVQDCNIDKQIPTAYIGGVGTTFRFDVVSELPSPTVHTVTVDGTNYSMSLVGPFSDGGYLWEYKTQLPVGTHSYTFTFSDTTGTITLPFNGVPFPGPEVHPFNVTGMKVNIATALPGDTVTYSAKYQSPTNTAPTVATVDIDGTSYPLIAQGTQYASGVTYTYSTTALSIGIHYYRFKFDDGSGLAIYEGLDKPSVTPLVLSSSSVAPTSGPASTVFIFSTTYKESNGAAPTTAMLYVDSTGYPMSYVSGGFKTGALFQVATKLPAGNHTFSFVFSDTVSNWADPFAPTVYAGPNVGPNATANSAGNSALSKPRCQS
jgi:hypothetical protein